MSIIRLTLPLRDRTHLAVLWEAVVNVQSKSRGKTSSAPQLKYSLKALIVALFLCAKKSSYRSQYGLAAVAFQWVRLFKQSAGESACPII